MLDLESSSGGSSCYGLTPSAMVSWIADFVDTYRDATGRDPLLYCTADWWETCTADSDTFGDTCPLVLARYADAPGEVPGGWAYQTIWQNSDGFAYGGDGGESGLVKLAMG